MAIGIAVGCAPAVSSLVRHGSFPLAKPVASVWRKRRFVGLPMTSWFTMFSRVEKHRTESTSMETPVNDRGIYIELEGGK